LVTLSASLGGLLFGYDTGVIAGAQMHLKKDFKEVTLNDRESVVSIAIFGAAIGSLIGGPMADIGGRRTVLMLADCFLAAGAFIMAEASSIDQIKDGRFIVGVGTGMAVMVVPVYLSEIAPKHIRGLVVACNIVFCTFGQLTSYVACYLLGDNWRLMLGIAAAPAIV
jgi:MFS family permease